MSGGVGEPVERAYAILESLSYGMNRATLASPEPANPHAQTALRTMTLRAALHPALSSALLDPMARIGGAYVSLDAQFSALLDRIAVEEPNLLHRLPRWDREKIALTGVSIPEQSVESHTPPDSEIGGIGGALWVPARNAAVACRVRAFVSEPRRSRARFTFDRIGWGAPQEIRPLGPQIAASAERALRAALLLLLTEERLPPGLKPGQVYYDVCCDDLTDSQLACVVGNSLDLPLALAFFSALTGTAIPAGVGATGALEIRAEAEPATVCPVGNTSDKAAAFFAVSPASPIFLAPADNTVMGGSGVTNLRQATAIALPDFPQPCSDTPRPLVAPNPTLPVTVVAHFSTASEGGADSDTRRPFLNATERMMRGALLEISNDALIGAAGFPNVDAALTTAVAWLQQIRCYPHATAEGRLQTLSSAFLPGIGIDNSSSADVHSENATAASVAASAAPGRILLTTPARRQLSPESDAGTLRSIGTHRLADLRPPLALWEFAHGAVEPPALRNRLDDRPHNLPVVVLPLFGREVERAQLTALLNATEPPSINTPQITLTGVGGVGKTRLALEAAAAASARFPDGIWLVPFGNTHSPTEIVTAVVETMRQGVPIVPTRQTERTTTSLASAVYTTLSASLTGRRVLLILDGGDAPETVGAVAQFVVKLHEVAPSVTCLTTARLPLGISGETVLPVSPLALSAATAMFRACSAQIRPNFAAKDGAETQSVAAIVQCVNGLPLAIELAASATAFLPLSEIETRLASATRSGNSGSGSPDILRQIIAWAYALLAPTEQRLLADLSIFVDGFTAESARYIAASPDTVNSSGNTLSHIGEGLLLLEQRSLLRRATGSERLYLPRLVQEFARHQLQVESRESQIQDRHSHYFVERAEELRRVEPNSERETRAFDRMEAERGNLRAAFERLRVTDKSAIPTLVVNLANFLRYRGYEREWQAWPRLALRLLPEGQTPLQARLHLCRAAAAMDIDDRAEAAPFLETAYQIAEACEVWETAAAAANLTGLLHSRQGNSEMAHNAHLRAYELYHRAGDRHGESAARNNLALLSARRGDTGEARAQFEAVAALCRAVDDRRGLARALGNLGALAFDAGDYAEAQRQGEACLNESRKLADTLRIALALLNIGEAMSREENYEAAVPHLAIAEAMLLYLRHDAGIAEAARFLNEAAPIYGRDRVEALQQELAEYRLPSLIILPPDRYIPRKLNLPEDAG